MWQDSLKQYPGVMRGCRDVATIRLAFGQDVAQIAHAYLTENDKVVKSEMQRLGISEKEGESAATNSAQDEALEKARAAAGDLARAQKARQDLRKVEIAYSQTKFREQGGTELPQGGVENIEPIPVLFDPDSRFDAADKPKEFLPGIRTWDETYKEHVELTNLIKTYYLAYPALYALVGAGSDESGARPEAVSKMTPEQARKDLGEALRDVRENIAKTHTLVGGLTMKMSPIHEQMLSGHIGAGAALNNDWTKPYFHSIAEDRLTEEQPGPWWQQLGVATLEAAAYVVVSLATGGLGAVLLAGAQAAISIGKYQALEAAAKSAATPDTVLVQNGEVAAAAAEAIIATALAFVAAVAAARGALALRLASQAGKQLAEDLGEDVARRLLLELTPEAAQALKNKLGAEALKDLAFRLAGGTIQKLAEDLSAVEIKALIDTIGFEALEKLGKAIGGKEIQTLANDLGAAILKSYGEEIAAADIKAMIAKHGLEAVKWLGKDLGGTAAKKVADQLTPEALKALQDIAAKDAAAVLDNMGAQTVNALAMPLKGKGLQELGRMQMFSFAPQMQQLLNAGRGAAARGLGALEGLSEDAIRQRLTAAGFTKVAEERGMQFYTHSDGSLVRMKIGPEAFTPTRPGPTVIREITKKAGDFSNKAVFAKVAENGTVIPAGTNFAKDSMKNWFKQQAGRAATPAEIDAMMVVWGDAGHVDIGP